MLATAFVSDGGGRLRSCQAGDIPKDNSGEMLPAFVKNI